MVDSNSLACAGTASCFPREGSYPSLIFFLWGGGLCIEISILPTELVVISKMPLVPTAYDRPLTTVKQLTLSISKIDDFFALSW